MQVITEHILSHKYEQDRKDEVKQLSIFTKFAPNEKNFQIRPKTTMAKSRPFSAMTSKLSAFDI